MDTRQKSVTEALRALLMRGDFAPGAHLMEIPLAQRLGVSRTPVRAALTTLAQEGLLIYRPQRGYVVRGFGLKEVVDAYRVRANLEGLACRLVAESGLDAAADAALERALAEGDAILRSGTLRDEDNAPWRSMNEGLHETILTATANASLIDVTRRTLALPFVSARVVHWHDFDSLKASHQLHHLIVRAIRRREAERAEAAMREHIWAATEIIARAYEAIRDAGGSAAQRAAPTGH